MKLVYSPSANQLRERILRRYTEINSYFDKLEENIRLSPYEVAEEKDIIDGKHITVYKRSVKTGLFSGNFKVLYLYLSLVYIINEIKQQIVIIGAYIK
jgi:hypothetical protein